MFRWLQGFVAGGTLGYVAGMLFAPKAGYELRRELAETSEDLITEASGYVTEMKTKGNQAMTDLRGRSERIKEKANTYLNEVKTSTDRIVEEAKPKVEKVVQDAKRTGKEMLEQSGAQELVDKMSNKPSAPGMDTPMQNSA
jgi:gas vesicle protein